MSFTVHLVRHGEVHNPQHLMYGRLPGYRLSQRGQQQAQAAAQWLKTRPLAALHASPMQRARETASILAAHNGDLPVHIDERLIEVNTPFEGRPLSELFARDWDLYRRQRAGLRSAERRGEPGSGLPGRHAPGLA